MNDWSPIWGLPLWFWLLVLPTILVVVSRLFRHRAAVLYPPIWRALDSIYFASGIVAACFMMLILLIIVVQMIARWTGFSFEGSTEFAGYAMAATSFFALAHALTRGAHIRVSIFLNMTAFTRMWLNAFAMLIAALTATYFARFAIKTNFLSEMLNDRTQGQDQVHEWVLTFLEMFITAPTQWGELWRASGDEWVYTPVWLPQLPMSFGTVLLAIAIWDHLIRLLVNNESSIQSETVE